MRRTRRRSSTSSAAASRPRATGSTTTSTLLKDADPDRTVVHVSLRDSWTTGPCQLVDLGVDEQPEQLAVELALLDLAGQDVERLRLGDRALVGPVGRGQRVVDVGDGHHPGRDRDVVGLE